VTQETTPTRPWGKARLILKRAQNFDKYDSYCLELALRFEKDTWRDNQRISEQLSRNTPQYLNYLNMLTDIKLLGQAGYIQDMMTSWVVGTLLQSEISEQDYQTLTGPWSNTIGAADLMRLHPNKWETFLDLSHNWGGNLLELAKTTLDILETEQVAQGASHGAR
jgi:hypothetical protein